MAYDETLAARVRDALADAPDLGERRMFGGLAFLSAGTMVCAVIGDELMVRLGEQDAAAALGEPHTRPMDFTGKVSRSAVFVTAEGLRSDPALRGWVQRALRFAQSV
jgi:TfoX/Sxy family transcriptional regulator of competence genes